MRLIAGGIHMRERTGGRSWRDLATVTVILCCTGLASAVEPEVAAKANDWVSRFAFQPPRAADEGICVPSGAALPSFEVTPAALGRQLVRVSLPFAPGTFPADLGLSVLGGNREIVPDLQVLTYHPGRPRTIRRAIVTFVHEFADFTPLTFNLKLCASDTPSKSPTSRPGTFEGAVDQTTVRLNADAVEVEHGGKLAWRAELVAPKRSWSVEPTSEVIAAGPNYLWVRALVPDGGWSRVIEVRTDALGTVAVRAHIQRMELSPEVIATAPDIGWRIAGPAADKDFEHSFSEGRPISISAGDLRVDFPDAHLLKRGGLKVSSGNGRGTIEYLRCRESEQVPMQSAMWRTATFVIAPKAAAPWTALLEPTHAASVPSEAFGTIYQNGRDADLSSWGLLKAARRYHLNAIASSTLTGDDFGNVASMPTSGTYGMNRLNHCPPILEEYYRTADARLRQVALHWCENLHDLGIWWGTTGKSQFGGTRYNNISRFDKAVSPNAPFMWRSNTSVSFCTKGYDAFFYAYEETGDPRMATALRWQLDYARDNVRCSDGQCRNIGDVTDFVRLYEFTGDRSHLDQALRLFRELRDKLSTGDLFDQGGRPIAATLPYIEDDEDGKKAGFAKPYIIGYALLGLPKLAGYCPDEPKLLDVVRAVAHFLSNAQDPAGAWRYPHPLSPKMHMASAIENAVQLTRAGRCLEERGESIESLLDAIERAMQQRILTWARNGKFCAGLGSWEEAAGLLRDGKRMTAIYRSPEERDRSRDYTEGALGFGDSAPEGVVYFFEVLNFYLAHRPAERLFHANETLQKVLDRIPPTEAAYHQPSASGDYLRYGVVDQLPTFRAQLLDRLAFPMAWDSGHGEDFSTWRSRARAKVLECLLPPPPRAEFSPVVIAREDRGTYEARKLVFNVSADCRIPAYLLIPKGPGPFPAVVALHDHGAFFVIGKEKMIRPFGDRPEIIAAANDWVKKLYGGRFVGDALAERGYVVFSADALYWGDRGRKEGVDHAMQQALASNLMQMGTTWLGVNTWDDIRAAEFVASLPEVDPKRIGAVGLSMGSHRTWMLHAVSDRIAAAAAVCWMGTTDALMSPGNNQTKGHSSYSMLAPNLRNYLDYPDVASIACPKPLMVFDGGEKDALFPVAGVDAAYARMHRVWDDRGAGDRLVTKRWDVGHVFNVEMQDEAFAWLDRWLKKPLPATSTP